MIAPNDPAAMNRYAAECIDAGIPYLYDPSMQLPRLERADLEKGCRGARILAGNDYEFGMMAEKLGMTEAELRRLAPITVMTRGEAGALITVGDEEFEIPPAKPRQVVDPTGAGDAFRAGLRPGYQAKAALAGRRPAGRADGRLRHRAPGTAATLLHARGVPRPLPREFRPSPELDDAGRATDVRTVDPRPFRLAETAGRVILMLGASVDRSRDRSSATDCTAATPHVSTKLDHPGRLWSSSLPSVLELAVRQWRSAKGCVQIVNEGDGPHGGSGRQLRRTPRSHVGRLAVGRVDQGLVHRRPRKGRSPSSSRRKETR